MGVASGLTLAHLRRNRGPYLMTSVKSNPLETLVAPLRPAFQRLPKMAMHICLDLLILRSRPARVTILTLTPSGTTTEEP